MEILETVDETRLTAVLDTLLPPHDGLEGAGGLGLAAAVIAGAREAPHLGEPAFSALSQVPDGFEALGADEREAQLRAVEAGDGASFGALINLAYNAYYTDPRVLERIERRTGYAARPPQPGGYELEPFDESVLSQVRKRAPFWREV